ncbi:MAG: YcjF family protein [Roseinatronobacter sp.]
MNQDAKPVLIELDDAPPASPDTAPPVPDLTAPQVAVLALGRARLSAMAKLGLGALGSFLMLALSVSAWDFITALINRNAVLGQVAMALLAAMALAALVWAAREIAGFRRLRRVDGLRRDGMQALADGDRTAALAVAQRIEQHFAGRADLDWPKSRLREGVADQPDADGVLGLCETVLLIPLDQRALAEVEAAARQVALLTALLPLPVLNVLAAMVTTLRMIRRIAEIYGGRAGVLGSVRLLRGVVAHLLATGAMAVGEDLVGSVASGGVVAKLSRRFGEGVVNAALTARLGIAATEVCRPLPYRLCPKPRTSAVMGRAVSGLFDRAGAQDK